MEKVSSNKIENIEDVSEHAKTADKDDRKKKVVVMKNDNNRGNEHKCNRDENDNRKGLFNINFQIDLVSIVLFASAAFTRMYRLDDPKNIVFDELHYGKYISLYMKNTFFFDTHPPLGKQLIAGLAYFVGYDGKFKFERIGSSYSDGVPLFALRFMPALFGSLLIPTAYHLMLELGLKQTTCILASVLLLLDNAILTQSRFILMESMLLFFSLFGILCILKFRKLDLYSLKWFTWLILAAISLTCALCIKYVGFYSCCLGLAIIARDFWKILGSKQYSDRKLLTRFTIQALVIIIIPALVYLGIFFVHLKVLYKAGPHDSIMTSAFQASLEGGLASITKGQPLHISHGSQITLRHTHGRTCWLHSHQHVYPVRYPDKRGSSHQQQVSCYSFKDVNNWWIVKRPGKNDLVVEQPVDVIKHGDVVQLVHGITSRALNSHDVGAPMSPQCQEISCYIDYNISMPAQNMWKVNIINRDQFGDKWHTIQSLVRLIHVDTNQALKFSGKQLPDWGFHQHEVVADRIISQDDTIWNVEEHRYTKSEDQKERERDLVNAEMIPTAVTHLSFWDKLYELHYKMMFSSSDGVQNHMYSSEPIEWPLMSRGIAYFVSNTSNAQIHLLGNIVIWYSSTVSLAVYFALYTFYLLRRRRYCFDLDEHTWNRFIFIGEIFFVGYLFHYLPYFFVERTLFLHHYLPAFVFKVLLMAALIEHILILLTDVLKIKLLLYCASILLSIWLCSVCYIFKKFTVLSYGMTDLSTEDILDLRLKDTWDFIVHKN
ncbi:PREDICTED: protein O-mannosyltransferase 1 [Nicrophorus vespilloides]|uniref:dolichyl-phosphate-mannose--protein mannosyltransferase n=1 Tax=Nicrophorus vespilloides TaxID=110193 RepID=A0ABM1ND24_NICVS|nr:PREDICTED: protein O-mannosyltransferase 1 [Nicrophorus vespilloides]